MIFEHRKALHSLLAKPT